LDGSGGGHPSLAERFLTIAGTLEATWRGIPVRTADPTSVFDAPTYANRTLRADVPFALEIRELMGADPVGNGSLVRADASPPSAAKSHTG
jgi:hypothetical protein